MQVGFVHQCLVAGKGDHPRTNLHIVCTQGNQFFSQHIFQFRHGLRNKRKLLGFNHLFCQLYGYKDSHFILHCFTFIFFTFDSFPNASSAVTT